MTPIKEVPNLDWTDEAAAEIAAAPTLVQDSDFAWQVGDQFIAGWHYPVLAGPPWFWFALTKGFTQVKLRKLLELQPRIPPNAHTLVKADWPDGDRFARYFAFKPTGERQGDYLVYRRN